MSSFRIRENWRSHCREGVVPQLLRAIYGRQPGLSCVRRTQPVHVGDRASPRHPAIPVIKKGSSPQSHVRHSEQLTKTFCLSDLNIPGRWRTAVRSFSTVRVPSSEDRRVLTSTAATRRESPCEAPDPHRPRFFRGPDSSFCPHRTNRIVEVSEIRQRKRGMRPREERPYSDVEGCRRRRRSHR